MKGYIALLALGICFFVPEISQAENLVQNGGFEYDMYGWTLINELENNLKTESNNANFTAIEGGRNLHAVITKADQDKAWRTSVKYPISVIMSPGNTWIMRISVKKLSDEGMISVGLMDNRPPWDSLFWTGNIDLSKQPVGSVVTYSYEFEIAYDIWYPAAVINMGGKVQDIIIDNVQIVRKDQDFIPAFTKLSGKIINQTTITSYKLYVVAYPEGDASWGDANAIIAPVNKSTMTWSMDVPSGTKYNVDLFDKTTYVYKRPTIPRTWNVSADSSQISGIDFTIRCKYYKSSVGWTSIWDACYQ